MPQTTGICEMDTEQLTTTQRTHAIRATTRKNAVAFKLCGPSAPMPSRSAIPVDGCLLALHRLRLNPGMNRVRMLQRNSGTALCLSSIFALTLDLAASSEIYSRVRVESSASRTICPVSLASCLVILAPMSLLSKCEFVSTLFALPAQTCAQLSSTDESEFCSAPRFPVLSRCAIGGSKLKVLDNRPCQSICFLPSDTVCVGIQLSQVSNAH
jgi:hypothetical protein